jgi:NAD(P)-dependent dehydrogenase (short-subunit alcohol dehydrogenase family)
MNIVISGVSSGIGRATVLALAEMGQHQIFGISRDAKKLEKLRLDVERKGQGSQFSFLAFDLAAQDYDQLSNAFVDFFELNEGNHIDILINNAAFLETKPLTEVDFQTWEQHMLINAFAALKLSQTMLRFFAPDLLSHIVNIGSMGGVQGTEKFPGLGVYSASKAALNSLTESMATEWKSLNIHTNSINPGSVQTEMLEAAFPGFKAPITSDEMGKFIADFALNYGKLNNGRIIEVSLRG